MKNWKEQKIIIKSSEIKQNKTSKQKKKFLPWLNLSMFVTFCPQVTTMTKKLIKARNLFHCKPPSGKNFDVCIFLCLVKLDFNSSETCVDGKRKVFFFSTYSKIHIYICSKFTFSKESYQMMRCIFFICLRLFWALDVKLRRFYRIP